MTLLQTFSGKLPTIAEHSKGNIFLEVCVCWSQKVSIAGLQGQKKRVSFWDKNVSKKTARSIGGNEQKKFYNKKSSHKGMQYITFNVLQVASQIHFLGFQKYQNAKLYSFFCSTNHRGDSYGSTFTTSNISFQLRRT